MEVIENIKVCKKISNSTDELLFTLLVPVLLECDKYIGKSILQVPDTGTRVLDNTRPFLCSSIVSF